MKQFNFDALKHKMQDYPLDVGNLTLGDLLKFSQKISDIESDQNDNVNRDTLTKQIFQFIAIWMVLILLILVYAGKGDLKFSDAVIITLISTTTANVLGFGVIVANYLFKQNHTDKGA